MKKTTGFTISLGLHGIALLIGGAMLIKPVQYAVDQGSGGIEINLVAAPAEPAPVPPVPVIEDIVQKAEIPVEKPVEVVNKEERSQTKGKDAVTVQSVGGALTEAKPDYLSNPAPPYPLEARRNKWEGIVVLKVAIDKEGRPLRVELEQSSGHKILDDSAVKTVKKWSFLPAKLGTMPVEATVHVPVRFTLER